MLAASVLFAVPEIPASAFFAAPSEAFPVSVALFSPSPATTASLPVAFFPAAAGFSGPDDPEAV
ncbi:hypothetical protein [Actinoplanes campanulatus]|uniref:hypothetical protein n=1 Tax=Actinoplanes campanulatus TaxID=113559 RepID=UPI001EF250B7|nr:hypothetical protein [Actinoplanes capillaceus]